MATYSKKRHVENTENEDEIRNSSEEDSLQEEESDDDESEEDIGLNEEIEVEFEALPPQQEDFHGIKRLMQQLFLKSNVDISGVVDVILSQNHIGCVIKQSEAQLAEESDSDDELDNNIYGVSSVISLSDIEDVPCIQQIKSLLLTSCAENADDGVEAEFKKLLTGDQHKVGLLLSERFLNIPSQLAPPLFNSIQSDLSKARDKNAKYNFDYFVLMCKSYQMFDQPKKKKKNKKRKGRNLDIEERDNFFSNAENEIFQEKSILSFKYSITEQSDTAIGGHWSSDETQYNTYRTVLVVPTSRMDDIVKEIQSEFN